MFEITNSSKMTLYYSWDLGMTSEIISRNMYSIAMSQKQDNVLSDSHSNCSLVVTALQKTVIKNHPILLKVLLSFRILNIFYEKYKHRLCKSLFLFLSLFLFILFRFPEARPTD